jgi:hypothetical protein
MIFAVDLNFHRKLCAIADNDVTKDTTSCEPSAQQLNDIVVLSFSQKQLHASLDKQ